MTTTTFQLTKSNIEQLPHFRKKTRDGEYSSACPQCGGNDRFLYWEKDGGYWCRRCELKGFVSDGNSLTFDRESWLKWQTEETERKRQEEERRLSILDRLNQSGRAQLYHSQMADRSYWYSQGLSDETIDRFQLGYCPACPTCQDYASYTIPVYYQGKLYNIRHRLKGKEGDKYRPEMAGLPAALFNADALHSQDPLNWMIVLVEGEVKAMALTQRNFPAVGIPGANGFKEKWVKLFSDSRVVYIALDPGKESEALKIGQTLKVAGIQVRLCSFPVKPDDFFVIYGGTPREFMQFLRLGERI